MLTERSPFCEHTAVAFRRWLRARHGSLDDAWGTAFWSQHYTGWAQMLPPRATQWQKHPGQALDFRRFWSAEVLAAYREQRDVIRDHSDRPVTTNPTVPGYQNLDLWPRRLCRAAAALRPHESSNMPSVSIRDFRFSNSSIALGCWVDCRPKGLTV